MLLIAALNKGKVYMINIPTDNVQQNVFALVRQLYFC